MKITDTEKKLKEEPGASSLMELKRWDKKVGTRLLSHPSFTTSDNYGTFGLLSSIVHLSKFYLIAHGTDLASRNELPFLGTDCFAESVAEGGS